MNRQQPFTQQLMQAGAAAAIYAAMFFINSWLFSALDFAVGERWFYLPAGLRLLLVLIFGLSGAIGISVASAAISLTLYFSHDPITGIVAGLISGFVPFVVQSIMQRFAGLEQSLRNINATNLLQLTLLYAGATSFIHQAWFLLRGVTENFWTTVWPMFVGDLLGSLFVLYAAFAVIRLLRKRGSVGIVQ